MRYINDRNTVELFRKINELQSPYSQKGTKDSERVSITDLSVDDLKEMTLDVFHELKLKVNQVAYGYANSLLITGASGLGKTYDTEQALDKSGKEYESISGGVSTAGLFELLFTRNDEIILFDDCDSVFGNQESVNILKAALDSGTVRKVSRNIKTHFNTRGMSMEDIMANYEGDESKAYNKSLFDIKNKGKLPQSFIYTGRIIFISNFSGDEIDPTIITRVSAHVDIDLSHQEVIERMNMIIKAVRPQVPLDKKEEVLRVMDYLHTHYVTRYPITIRGLINAIDTRVANDFLTNAGGRSVPMWQLLLKKDMLGNKVIKRD